MPRLRRASRRYLSVALPVTIVLVGAGCADGDDSTTALSAVSTSTTTAAADKTTSAAPTTVTPTTAAPPTVAPGTTAATTTAVADDVDIAALEAIVDTWLADANTFGVTVSIRRSGHDDINLASGLDDRGITAVRADGSEVPHTESAMSTDGTFPIGYITRTFVAAAALQLVAEGRITLDESVTPWLPELPNADQTTLRMLLGYTAGLGQWDEGAMSATLLADLTHAFTPEEVLAKHLQAPPAGLPGGDPSFGRASYIAVGLLIQRLLGTDLATVIHDRFIEPLGLDSTVFTDGTVRPTRHGWLDAVPRPGTDRANDILDAPLQAVMTVQWASEAMISSSSDVLDWAESLFGGEVLGPEGTTLLLDMNPISPPPVPNRYFGLGATGYCLQPDCDPDSAELVGAPGGGFCCWSTQLVHDRRSGTTILVATNTNAPTPEQMIELPKAILDSVADE